MVELTRRTILACLPGIATGAVLPSAALGAAGPPTANASAEDVMAEIAERLLAEYPENASHLGLDGGVRTALKSELTDRSRSADRSRADWARRTAATLRRFDQATLSPATRVDLDVATAALDLAIDGWRFPMGDMAVLSGQNSYRNTPYTVTQKTGAFVDTPDVLENQHDIVRAEDADAYLERLRAFGGQLKAETERLRDERDRGAAPPDVVLDITLRQMETARAEPVKQWKILAGFTEKARAARLSDASWDRALDAVGADIALAMDQQIEAVRASRAIAQPEVGVWKRPGGDEYYAWALRASTSTHRTAPDLHALGRALAVEIQSKMDRLLRTQGMGQGTVGDRMTALSQRPDQIFPNDDEGRAALLSYLQGRVDNMRSRMCGESRY